MYLPPQFAETRIEELHRIVREHALGVLITNSPTGLDANHLPFMLDVDQGGCGVLIAHVARANPLWREVQDGQEALVVFRGVQGSAFWFFWLHRTRSHNVLIGALRSCFSLHLLRWRRWLPAPRYG